MTNDDLAVDYLIRSRKRRVALDALCNESAWADVVRESQEVIELTLKGLLRSVRIICPHHTHDVSAILLANREVLPDGLQDHLEDFARVSRSFRRDREIAFYGTENLTPSSFYQQEDADIARTSAKKVVGAIFPFVVLDN